MAGKAFTRAQNKFRGDSRYRYVCNHAMIRFSCCKRRSSPCGQADNLHQSGSSQLPWKRHCGQRRQVHSRMPGMVQRNGYLRCIHYEQGEALLAQVCRHDPDKGYAVYLLGVQLRRCETDTVFEDGGDQGTISVWWLYGFQAFKF